jgi:pilus assembly protein FimV
MPRRLNRISALALALLPALAGALGLGGIRGDSALNEPFLARIELNGVAPEELDGVKVILASEAEFTKAGSPRSDFLTGLIFVPEVSPEGKVQVRVTSTKPIREPYLDFLVEVTWPKGRMVKGYTVLLDPPTTLHRPPPKVTPPKALAPVQAPAAAPVSPSTAPPDRSPVFAGQTTSPSPQARVPAPAPLPPPPPGYPLRYGPVPSGGNLTSVARRMAPEGASQAQTALAIYRANPQAFSGGNINRVKAGARLEIPHPHLIFAFDAEAAKQQFLAAQRGQPLPPLPVTPQDGAPDSGSELIQDRLEIARREPEVAGEGLATASVPVSPTAQPPAASPSSSESGAASSARVAPELALVEREILLVREMAESGRQETADLRGRISRLEDHLSDIKRLLELSNAQLAQLQGAGARGEPAGNIGRLETEPGRTGRTDVGTRPGARAPGPSRVPA